MGQRSSIDRLDPTIRAEVDAAIKRGSTIDVIVAKLRELGADVSRSAVGRYSKQYAALAARQRDMSAVANAFASEFGTADDLQGRLMIQLVTSLITRTAMAASENEEPEFDFKELHFLARAVKDAASAAKTDTDREARIRDEAAKEEKRKAAERAESSARSAGASPETIHKVRAAILGLDA